MFYSIQNWYDRKSVLVIIKQKYHKIFGRGFNSKICVWYSNLNRRKMSLWFITCRNFHASFSSMRWKEDMKKLCLKWEVKLWQLRYWKNLMYFGIFGIYNLSIWFLFYQKNPLYHLSDYQSTKRIFYFLWKEWNKIRFNYSM